MSTHYAMNGEDIEFEFYSWYWETCCDCGLAHYVGYSKKDKAVFIKKVFRDDWQTIKNRMEMSEQELKDAICDLQQVLRRKRRVNKKAESEEK